MAEKRKIFIQIISKAERLNFKLCSAEIISRIIPGNNLRKIITKCYSYIEGVTTRNSF